jgi:hypothetical protein
MNNIDKLSKRLLQCMQEGIAICYADGHRCLEFHEVLDRVTLKDKLLKANLYKEVDEKIYEDVYGALDHIDHLLKIIGNKSLEEKFDDYNDFFYEKEFYD